MPQLDAAVSKRLDQLPKGRVRSAHFLLVEAVNDFVAREEKRQAFKAEALARCQEARASLAGNTPAAMHPRFCLCGFLPN